MKKGTIALILALIAPLLWFFANLGPYVNIAPVELPLLILVGWLFSVVAFILALVARSKGEKALGGLILGFIGAVLPFVLIGGCILLLNRISVNVGC